MSTFEERMVREQGETLVINGLTIQSIDILWSNGTLMLTTWKKHFRVLDGETVLVEDILEPTDTFERYLARMKRP